MKISILTLGTRGNVQPYAALGQALLENGHEVTLSTAKNFKSLVAEHHLNFCPIDIDDEELLNSKEGKKIFIIYPLGDQNFWGLQAYKKGVGIKPVPLAKLSPEAFVESLKQLISEEKLYTNSALMAKKINSENGLKNAVAIKDLTSNNIKNY